MPTKILIVDDDPVSRRVLRQILAQAEPGCVVVEAHSGIEACVMLEMPGHGIEFVFLDLTMPDFDGFEVLDRIRQVRSPQSPAVILCSSATDRSTVLKAAAAGARHFIVKPPRVEVVAEKLRQVRATRGTASRSPFETAEAAAS
jgi:two-component system chemotaxis response regulator CheY